MKLMNLMFTLLTVTSLAFAASDATFATVKATVIMVGEGIFESLRGLYDHWEISVANGDVTFEAENDLILDAGGSVLLNASITATSFELDTLTVNDVLNFAWAGGEQLWSDYVFVDTGLTCSGVAEFEDTIKCTEFIQFSDSIVAFLNADGTALFGGDSAGNFTIRGYLAVMDSLFVNNNVELNGNATVANNLLVGDTLGVNTANPEYLFHVYNENIYSMFEGDASGQTYVAVNNGHASNETGFAIFRQDTLRWTIEDSNGTFIIFQADSVANRLQISPTTGNVTIPQNLGVTGWISADSIHTTHLVATDANLGGATDTIAWIDEIAGDTLQAIVINGVVTRITNY